jgi:hypothetical protein
VIRAPRVLSARVVGVTFAEGYPNTVARIADLTAGGETVPGKLMRDPNNPHDPNAVKVVCVAAGGHIGHLPRNVAAQLAPVLDRGTEYAVLVESVEHPNHPTNPGIQVRLERKDVAA